MEETLMSLSAGVSFAKTPLSEIGEKHEQITAAGWTETRRGDPWVVAFEKRVPENTPEPDAELRSIMGEYWVTADEIRGLLASAS